MAILSGYHIELNGLQAGEPTTTRLEYGQESTFSAASSKAGADWFYSNSWPLIKAMLHQNFRLIEIRAQYHDGAGGTKPFYTRVVDEPGDIDTGDSLGPNLVVRMYKVPENDAIWPTSAEPFEGGMTRWSGIPEADQNNGLLSDTAVDDWNDVFEGLETLEPTISGSPVTFFMVMLRKSALGVTVAYAPVIETYCGQTLGTQNTRKRS